MWTIVVQSNKILHNKYTWYNGRPNHVFVCVDSLMSPLFYCGVKKGLSDVCMRKMKNCEPKFTSWLFVQTSMRTRHLSDLSLSLSLNIFHVKRSRLLLLLINLFKKICAWPSCHSIVVLAMSSKSVTIDRMKRSKVGQHGQCNMFTSITTNKQQQQYNVERDDIGILQINSPVVWFYLHNSQWKEMK